MTRQPIFRAASREERLQAWARIKKGWRKPVACWAALQILTAYAAHNLYRAATEGQIFGGRTGSGHLIRFDEEPLSFAVVATINVLGILMLCVLPVWLMLAAWLS